MTHIWYHHSGCELFGVWTPGHVGSLPSQTIAPDEFVQECREKALRHARSITHLTEKVLNLEPNHLFRDAWFGVCLLDSTRIQLAGLQPVNVLELEEPDKSLISNLKIHVRALSNTKSTILLAGKIVSNMLDHGCFLSVLTCCESSKKFVSLLNVLDWPKRLD